jgi:anti-sigma factor RsiW
MSGGLWPLRPLWRSSARRDRQAGGRASARPVVEADLGQISESKLHAYVDDALSEADRLNVEGFLAMRPDIAARIEAYRSQTIALHAAFNTGEEALPPSLADLSRRLVRARATSAVITLTLVTAGGIAILLAILKLAE